MTKQKNKPLKLKNNNLALSVDNYYSLSIQISLDGFSFCIYNSTLKQLEALKNYDIKVDNLDELLSKIKFIFKTEPLLDYNFNKVNVCHINNLSTLVPKSLFDSSKLNQYLNLSIKTLKNDYFDYDELSLIEAVNVYIPFVNVNNFMIDRFGSFEFNHISSLFIKNILEQSNKSINSKMYVYVFENKLYIIVCEVKKLIFYNSFNYLTKEDFIYYILFVAEQLEMNSNNFELNLLGNITNNSELYILAHKYIKNIKLFNYNLNYDTLIPLSDLQKRRFYNLLHQI